MKRICIIDDDKIYQTIVLKHLERMAENCEFLSMEDGEDAITQIRHMIKENKPLPDLILLDINMPIMDGWDFLNEFRTIKNTLGKKINIIIVTSSVDDRDMTKAQEYSEVSGYIVKPIVSSDLRKVIDRFVNLN